MPGNLSAPACTKATASGRPSCGTRPMRVVNSERNRAEGRLTPCGKQNCTLRRVLEYLPQSTQVLSAKYAGAFHTSFPCFPLPPPLPTAIFFISFQFPLASPFDAAEGPFPFAFPHSGPAGNAQAVKGGTCPRCGMRQEHVNARQRDICAVRVTDNGRRWYSV